MTIASETTALTADEAIGPVARVKATRIGFLSDDHNTSDSGDDLPAEVLEAFQRGRAARAGHARHQHDPAHRRLKRSARQRAPA